MNVLVIGSGAREHALVWKLRQSPRITRIACAPGNAGIAELAEVVDIQPDRIDALLEFARRESIDLTVVGPELPLTAGIVDLFGSHRLPIFGPAQAAARLEGSKIFAKQFMRRHGIPTAGFRSFTAAERSEAERYLRAAPLPVVLKADGLASGKGVTVCQTTGQALEMLALLMEKKIFGEAGANVVIEEFLSGEEASVFAITDGEEFVTLPPAQDHKRLLDGDQGENTGGMGAYAPAPAVTPELLAEVRSRIIAPTLRGLREEGTPYKGCLYVGLMITETGANVIEYNCRFGDPETEVVLPLLDEDLAGLLLASAGGGGMLPRSLRVKAQSAVCVVMASRGYPGPYQAGKPIRGLDIARAEPGVIVFHAGTRRTSGIAQKEEGNSAPPPVVTTAGGRVLGVTAVGPRGDLQATIDRAYRAVGKISFDGAYYRSDIGRKGLAVRKTGSAQPAGRPR